mgnify:CR=1 FL=1
MPDITRRDFLKLMKGTGIAVGAGAIAAPMVAYFYPPDLRIYPDEPAVVVGALGVGTSRIAAAADELAVLAALDLQPRAALRAVAPLHELRRHGLSPLGLEIPRVVALRVLRAADEAAVAP